MLWGKSKAAWNDRSLRKTEKWRAWKRTSRWPESGKRRPARGRPPQPARSPSASRSRSGTPSLSGPGISWLITVLFAVTTSWISVLSARRIRLARPARNAPLLGEFVTMHFTSTVLADGSRLVKSVHSITVNGSSKSTATRSRQQWWTLFSSVQKNLNSQWFEIGL